MGVCESEGTEFDPITSLLLAVVYLNESYLRLSPLYIYIYILKCDRGADETRGEIGDDLPNGVAERGGCNGSVE